MDYLLKRLFFILFVICNFSAFGQSESTKRLSLEIGSGVGGPFGVGFEMHFVPKIAGFVALSIIPHSIDEPLGFEVGVRMIPEISKGIFISLAYGTASVYEGGFYANEGKNYLKGITGLMGYRFNIKNSFGADIGAGLHFITEEQVINSDNSNNIMLAIQIGIGYHF